MLAEKQTQNGAKVLVADNALLSADGVYVRSDGGDMIVSNATLNVTSKLNVGFSKKSGGKFVLSGENAKFNYSPDRFFDVFAAGSGHAEFHIENGSGWSVDSNARLCIKTSNSVF